MVDFNAVFKDANRSSRSNVSEATEAMEWYKKSVNDLLDKKKDPNKIFLRKSFEIGSMFIFVYDAKHKDTLPFFDMYPLVFPIERYPDGFLGLNLHYLPPGARLGLLEALKTIRNNNKYNETTKLNISYRLLKAYSNKFAGYQNCIKRYLTTQLRSSFFFVDYPNWDKAAKLPLQKWKINGDQKYAGKPPY